MQWVGGTFPWGKAAELWSWPLTPFWCGDSASLETALSLNNLRSLSPQQSMKCNSRSLICHCACPRICCWIIFGTELYGHYYSVISCLPKLTASQLVKFSACADPEVSLSCPQEKSPLDLPWDWPVQSTRTYSPKICFNIIHTPVWRGVLSPVFQMIILDYFKRYVL